MKIKRHNPQTQRYICVRKGNDIQRVDPSVADKLVRNDGYQYIPRSIWKEEVRDKT